MEIEEICEHECDNEFSLYSFHQLSLSQSYKYIFSRRKHQNKAIQNIKTCDNMDLSPSHPLLSPSFSNPFHKLDS